MLVVLAGRGKPMTTRLKVEMIAVLIVLALAAGALAWHEHGVATARAVLDKEHRAETEALVVRLTADTERRISQANQANAAQVAQLAVQLGQLSNRMGQLSGQLVSLQAAQAAQLTEIQKMSSSELLVKLRQELGPAEGAVEAVPLTRDDLVQVDSWKVERDSCVKQLSVKDQQLQTCSEGNVVRDQTITVQADSIKLLNGAVEEQKQITAAREKQCQEDLKAKKTSRWKWAGIGALVSEVIRIFVKGAF